jgi:hypothetical protein
MASDITSEADFLEKNPSPWTLESESGKWMSNTPSGTPGKGELYYSATDDGALTKHMECGNQKRCKFIVLCFWGCIDKPGARWEGSDRNSTPV